MKPSTSASESMPGDDNAARDAYDGCAGSAGDGDGSSRSVRPAWVLGRVAEHASESSTPAAEQASWISIIAGRSTAALLLGRRSITFSTPC